ncbi:hypothetical protein K8I31_11405 [bacterium]|nr:hypothetical protein [bacterium]
MEVISHIPDSIGVSVVTAAPEWLFRNQLKRDFTYRKLDHDCGVVQPDSLSIDSIATLDRWRELLEKYPEMARLEAVKTAEYNSSVIIGDISPFAVAVACEANLPCFITANFCWNWIFEEYAEHTPGFNEVIEQISAFYRQTDCLLRTPLAGDLSVFPNIQDIPMIVRTSKKSRSEMRKQWGVEDDRRIALLSFGGMGVNGVKPEILAKYPHWTFLTFDQSFEGLPNVIYFEPRSIYHPDLVNAVDLVIAKLGYGLNTECIAHHTPMAYVPRTGFREYEVLERETAKWIPMAKIETGPFFQGNWDAIDALYEARSFQTSKPEVQLGCNGGKVAAQMILDEMNRVSCRVVQSA